MTSCPCPVAGPADTAELSPLLVVSLLYTLVVVTVTLVCRNAINLNYEANGIFRVRTPDTVEPASKGCMQVTGFSSKAVDFP